MKSTIASITSSSMWPAFAYSAGTGGPLPAMNRWLSEGNSRKVTSGAPRRDVLVDHLVVTTTVHNEDRHAEVLRDSNLVTPVQVAQIAHRDLIAEQRQHLVGR